MHPGAALGVVVTVAVNMTVIPAMLLCFGRGQSNPTDRMTRLAVTPYNDMITLQNKFFLFCRFLGSSFYIGYQKQ